jgi:hypothetical protein
MNNNNDWNFGDGFPSIEIDADYWKGLTLKEKGQYLLRLIFQEKDLGNRIQMMNYILGNSAKIGRTFIKNPEAKEYLDILENSANLISVSAALGNILKQKQKFRSTKNNDIAKLMGLPNGNYVSETHLDITHAMAEAFVDMSDYHKDKYTITLDNIVTDDGKKNNSNNNTDQGDDTSYVSISKTIKLAGTIDKDNKWGIIIKTTGGMFEDEDTTSSTTCKLFYPVTGMKMHPDDLEEKIQKIMYELYIEKVDTRSNFVKINGTRLEICKRKEIDVEITNIDVKRITNTMRKVLSEDARRGAVLVGEPGVGKTICVHKLTNQFRDKLVFWVSPDSINSTMGIRQVFKIFSMFPHSIVVFDDLDSGPFTSKDEITGEFISLLDGTNNKDFKAFVLATVNDPSKLHSSLVRPERFDELIHVKTPQTAEEVINIIFVKAELRGYYPIEQFDDDPDMMEEDDVNGKIMFKSDDPELITLAGKIIEAKFTQAMVAGLINDAHYMIEDNELSVNGLAVAVTERLNSIDASNMVAKKGRLSIDTEALSDEANANLAKKNTKM